jgi:nitroreductase
MFTGEKIDDEVINRILANANQAPSHKKTNPWRFHVFTGKGLQRLADFFQATYKSKMSLEEFKELKYNKLGTNPLKASHVIAIGAKLSPEVGLPEWEEIAAVAASVQNLYLSVTASSLGGYWSSPVLMIRHIHELIDLEENEKCLGFFYIGVPQDSLELEVDKGDVNEKAKWYH